MRNNPAQPRSRAVRLHNAASRESAYDVERIAFAVCIRHDVQQGECPDGVGSYEIYWPIDGCVRREMGATRVEA